MGIFKITGSFYALQHDVTHHTKSLRKLETGEIKKRKDDVALPDEGIAAEKAMKPGNEACK
jgi:hypothetical protein